MNDATDPSSWVPLLAFVRDYYLHPNPASGLGPVHDATGAPIPGTLCLDTGKPGPTVAINAMMHLSEPAGLAAHAEIVARWQAGDRPPGGRILLTLGHAPEPIIRTIHAKLEQQSRGRHVNADDDHVEDDARLLLLGREVWQQAHGAVLDIHSTPNAGDSPLIMPYLPIVAGDGLAKLTTDRARGKYIKSHGIDLKATAAAIAPLIQGMPVRHVALDYYNYAVIDPRMQSYFGKPAEHTNGTPLVLESGGPNLDPATQFTARYAAQAWLSNTLGWKPRRSFPEPQREYYSHCQTIYHPLIYDKWGAEHPFSPEELKETYYMLNGPDAPQHVTHPRHREMLEQAVKQFAIPEEHLSNFHPLKAGTPIAIGGDSGRILTTLDDCYPLFGASHSMASDSPNAHYLMVVARQRHKARDLSGPAADTGLDRAR